MTKKKNVVVEVRMEEELRDSAKDYAAKHGFSLSGLIRGLLRRTINPLDPSPVQLPQAAIDREKRRPPRKKNQPPEE